jgi:hypothetical protein
MTPQKKGLTVQSPKDLATGQNSGKRQQEPLTKVDPKAARDIAMNAIRNLKG